MKKAIAILLVITSLCYSCGGSGSKNESTTDTTNAVVLPKNRSSDEAAMPDQFVADSTTKDSITGQPE